nr:hypothetical protein SHINE37_44883 [Rhizobiaceae bacterium]
MTALSHFREQNPSRPVVGPSLESEPDAKGSTDAQHHSPRHPHPASDRRAAELGIQPKLGLRPLRRPRADRAHPSHPRPHGTYLIPKPSQEPEP